MQAAANKFVKAWLRAPEVHQALLYDLRIQWRFPGNKEPDRYLLYVKRRKVV